MKILKRIWAAIWPTTKSSSPDTSTEETSSNDVVEFLKSKGMTDEEDIKFKTFKEIMDVQEDLRRTFNSNIDGVSLANKMEGLELDYKILSSLIHFDIIGVQPMVSHKGDAYYLDWDDNNSKNLVIKCEDMKAKTREIHSLTARETVGPK